MNKKIKFIDSGSIKAPTTLRRFVAGLLDLILLIVLSSVVFVFAAQPIAATNPTYQQITQASQSMMLESGLYVQNDHDIVKIYINNDSYEVIDAALTSFYCRYQSCHRYDEIKQEHINQTKEEDVLFYIDESTNSVRVIDTKKDSDLMKTWLVEQVDHALITIFQRTTMWRNAFTAMILSILFVMIIASIIVSLVLYLWIPWMNFGQTIGHRLMGISIYSFREEDIIPSSKDVMLRYLAFAFVQMLGGLLTLGVIPVISFFVSISGQKSMSFHDRLSRTKMVAFSETPTEEMDAFAYKALYGEDVNLHD